jgi:hypothetical protein
MVALIDREAHSVKVRQTEFPGLRVSQILIQQMSPMQNGGGNSIVSP